MADLKDKCDHILGRIYDYEEGYSLCYLSDISENYNPFELAYKQDIVFKYCPLCGREIIHQVVLQGIVSNEKNDSL